MRSSHWFLLGMLACCSAATAATSRVPTLDDLLSDPEYVDVAVSPSGKHIALVHRSDDADRLVVIDVGTNESRPIVQFDRRALGAGTEAYIRYVRWKSDDRMIFGTGSTLESARTSISRRTYGRLGTRVFGVDRDGRNMVRLLSDVDGGVVRGTIFLGGIESLLPRDPDHIVMSVYGTAGGALLRVDVSNGRGELLADPDREVSDWWLDVDGNPVAKEQESNGVVTFFSRQPDGSWIEFDSVRQSELDQLPDFQAIGPSDRPEKYYVIARPEGRDRMGLYLYDLRARSFGEPIVEHGRYDLGWAAVSSDGARVLRTCRIEDAVVCETSDAEVNSHLRAIRKHFAGTASVRVKDASQDQRTLVLRVDGPSVAPALYLYEVDRNRITPLGSIQPRLADLALPTAEVIRWRASDGLELTGYLTRPHGAAEAKGLPLVVMPHGGPEARDWLTFDLDAQYLASIGYAVFQPNFRGSAGQGKQFAELGYRQWGRRMQDDVTDGVHALVERGIADPRRICIVGASYGGYAALAGAAFTPELYRCAVSRAGVSELESFIKYRRTHWGRQSEWYTYWQKAIGDPETEASALAAASPALHAESVKVPVLLIHGGSDEIVPIEQSRRMKSALVKARKSVELIEVRDEGHGGWSDKNEKLQLEATGRFLQQWLGPGYSGAKEAALAAQSTENAGASPSPPH